MKNSRKTHKKYLQSEINKFNYVKNKTLCAIVLPFKEPVKTSCLTNYDDVFTKSWKLFEKLFEETCFRLQKRFIHENIFYFDSDKILVKHIKIIENDMYEHNSRFQLLQIIYFIIICNVYNHKYFQ